MGEVGRLSRGRVLVVGNEPETSNLTSWLDPTSFEVLTSAQSNLLEAVRRTSPDAIVLAARDEVASFDALSTLRQDERAKVVPVLLEGPAEVLRSPLLRSLAIDELVPADRANVDLERRLTAVIRAQRLVEAEARTRSHLEALLEIGQAAASSLDLDEILKVVVKTLSQALHSDRCAVLLCRADGKVVVEASIEDPGGHLELDLTRYPELQLALESKQTVIIEDAQSDPRMAAVKSIIAALDVRSILVQPVVSGGELMGALFLRQRGEDAMFTAADTAFARGAAASIGDHLRNARLFQDLKRKRDQLESAYVDRYRELATANRRLKELNQFKDELIAICSHDLRAPLNVLLGHSQLLMDEDLSGVQAQSVDAIVRQGRKILELVESLLEKGRGEAQRLTLEPSDIDLSHQSMDAARELDILARARSVTVRVEAPEQLWTIADRVKIRQVLQNLIQNAISHAAKRVTVHVERVRREDIELARLSVVDDGPGIAPGELGVIFDRYRHGPRGIGLGLSICQEFVELHGGEIWAENLKTGGAAVRVLLPLKRDAGADSPVERPRILIVEDEPAIAQAGSEILRTRYRVEVARDGAEGIAKARSLKPDLVLMGLFLPKVDGLDASNILRNAPDTAHIPVLLMLTDKDLADKVKGLHLGVTDFVSKPFNSPALLARVGEALVRNVRRVESPKNIAVVDPLTGLLDRSSFLRFAELERARAIRYSRPLTLAVLAAIRPPDDPTLEVAAGMLRRQARAVDLLGLHSPGVFVALLPESTLEAGTQFSDRLISGLHPTLGDVRRACVSLQPPPPELRELALESLIASVLAGLLGASA